MARAIAGDECSRRRVRVTVRATSRGTLVDDVVATRVETRSDARERELVDAMLARCAPGATTADVAFEHEGRALRATSNATVEAIGIEDGATVTATTTRRRDDGASEEARRRTTREREDEREDEDDDLVVPLTGTRKRAETFMRERLGTARWTANVVARFPALRVACWAACARCAAAIDAGPPFVLLTGFALVCGNLGRRRPGEASAYSIFNPGCARLPGQLTADDADDAARGGFGASR